MRPGATLLAVLAAAPVSLAAAELPEHERTLRGRVVAGVAAGKRSRVYVDIAGRTTRAVVVAASAEEITVRPSGVTMQLRWEQIGPARRLGIYAKYVDEKQAPDWLALARYALSAGENEAACEYL